MDWSIKAKDIRTCTKQQALFIQKSQLSSCAASASPFGSLWHRGWITFAADPAPASGTCGIHSSTGSKQGAQMGQAPTEPQGSLLPAVKNNPSASQFPLL